MRGGRLGGRLRRRDEVDERPARLGPHRGEVGEDAPERLAPDAAQVGSGKEVMALHHGIGLEDEVLGVVASDHRAVVAGADEDVGARGQRRAEAADHPAFAERGERGAGNRGGVVGHGAEDITAEAGLQAVDLRGAFW